MTPEGHNELMPLLQEHLQKASQPMTCYDMYEIPEVQKVAPSANRVSDYLGLMFRQGLAERVPVAGVGARAGRARWAYIWRGKDLPPHLKAKGVEARGYKPRPVLDRPNLFISDNGDYVTLEMPEITIQIQIHKKPKGK